jgi:hypothetical protein
MERFLRNELAQRLTAAADNQTATYILKGFLRDYNCLKLSLWETGKGSILWAITDRREGIAHQTNIVLPSTDQLAEERHAFLSVPLREPKGGQ